MDIQSSFLANRAYTDVNRAQASSVEKESLNQVETFAREFSDTLQGNEAKILDTLVSSADPHTLVHALTETEIAIETAVTVRNKVVEAYQEIMRMPV